MTPIEAIQGNLKSLNESLAQCAEAVTAQADAQEGVARRMEEMSVHMSELSDGFGRIESLLGNFIRETEKLRSDVRPVIARLKVLDGQR